MCVCEFVLMYASVCEFVLCIRVFVLCFSVFWVFVMYASICEFVSCMKPETYCGSDLLRLRPTAVYHPDIIVGSGCLGLRV